MKKLITIFGAMLFASFLLLRCGEYSNQHTFKEVKIGNQVWMDNNLNVDNFRNGDPIPLAETDEEARQEGEKHRPVRIIINDTIAHKTYQLYNWYAVNDPRGIAPDGWHVPSKEEMHLLISDINDNLEMELEKLKIDSNYERWWTTTASTENDVDATSFAFELKLSKGKAMRFKNGTDKHKCYWVRCLKDY